MHPVPRSVTSWHWFASGCSQQGGHVVRQCAHRLQTFAVQRRLTDLFPLQRSKYKFHSAGSMNQLRLLFSRLILLTRQKIEMQSMITNNATARLSDLLETPSIMFKVNPVQHIKTEIRYATRSTTGPNGFIGKLFNRYKDRVLHEEIQTTGQLRSGGVKRTESFPATRNGSHFGCRFV